ncbi:hypothetical protein [Pectinatus frisingensis]|nr:hypothetical protein [Pectinatus frisingensis]
MAIAKRCFICAHKQNDDGSCTNPDCPRYEAPVENPTTTVSNNSTDTNTK